MRIGLFMQCGRRACIKIIDIGNDGFRGAEITCNLYINGCCYLVNWNCCGDAPFALIEYTTS